MKRIVGSLLLAVGVALPACTSDVPYKPDRTVVKSIPRAVAKAELRRLLGKARATDRRHFSGTPLVVRDVTDGAMSFAARVPRFGFIIEEEWVECRFPYAGLAPRDEAVSQRGTKVIVCR